MLLESLLTTMFVMGIINTCKIWNCHIICSVVTQFKMEYIKYIFFRTDFLFCPILWWIWIFRQQKNCSKRRENLKHYCNFWNKNIGMYYWLQPQQLKHFKEGCKHSKILKILKYSFGLVTNLSILNWQLIS